jgi:hypothetical protein
VKLADLEHNSDPTRLNPGMMDDWTLARMKKYAEAKELLLSDD